jgi:hypothetical protein
VFLRPRRSVLVVDDNGAGGTVTCHLQCQRDAKDTSVKGVEP